MLPFPYPSRWHFVIFKKPKSIKFFRSQTDQSDVDIKTTKTVLDRIFLQTKSRYGNLFTKTFVGGSTGTGAPPPPASPLFWVKRKEMTERRKASRASKSNRILPLAQGLDPPLTFRVENYQYSTRPLYCTRLLVTLFKNHSQRLQFWGAKLSFLYIYLLLVAREFFSLRVQSVILERVHDEVTCPLFGHTVDVNMSCFGEVVQYRAQRLGLGLGFHSGWYYQTS